jgi:hypothetical protein
MVEHLHRASFNAPRVPREEMIDSLQDALKKDILYELPANYMVCATSRKGLRCLVKFSFSHIFIY